MPEEPLYGVKISPLVKQVGCKAVTQAVNTSATGYAGFFFASE
jgi:hypothetical protein